MTAQEVLDKYKIPQHVLDEYHSWGLCSSVQLIMEDWKYSDQDIERLSDIMVLHDMGFTETEVKYYMELSIQGDRTKQERMKLLNKQRGKVLDEIHFKERQIERMDYLRNEIRK